VTTLAPAALQLRLTARSFRSWAEVSLELSDGVTLLYGTNGAGKTNLVEALAVALTGRSPRTASLTSCIADGQLTAITEIDVSIDGPQRGHWQRTIERGNGRGRWTRDGKPVTGGDPRVAVTTFLPEHVLTIRGAPQRRRALIDAAVTNIQAGSAQTIARYEQALVNRNALLRRARASGRPVDPSELEPWSAQLASAGDELRAARQLTMDQLTEPLTENYRRLAGRDQAVAISSSWNGEELGAQLSDSGSADQAAGMTLVGPHRDQITLRLDGNDTRNHASAGEQRTVMLAWTIAVAQQRHTDALNAGAHVTILDEPCAELDADRVSHLSDLLRLTPGVVVLTSTERISELPGRSIAVPEELR
jgi:DNA replication and repair protein RecF